jgi:hypothetical protein
MLIVLAVDDRNYFIKKTPEDFLPAAVPAAY